MKHIWLVAVVVLMGCTHNVNLSRSRNGIVQSQTIGAIGIFSSELHSSTRNRAMTTCLAELGDMGGLEQELCTERVQNDEERRARTLNGEFYPYYGY